MRLFMFGNNEHSATKEINILNDVLEDLNEDLNKENDKLSLLKNEYDYIYPMQFKYVLGTAEHNHYVKKINKAQNQYYKQFNKTQEIHHKIDEVQHEISLLQ